jgi:hypothetical protein
MTTVTDAEAVRLYPELANLIALRDAGWKFLPVTTQEIGLVELDGFRAWPDGVTDGLRIYSATNVLGIRTLPTEPPSIVWERTSSLSDVVNGLLALPAPSDRLAPRLVIATRLPPRAG